MNKMHLAAVGLLALPLLLATPAEGEQRATCGHVKSDFNGDGHPDVAAGASYDGESGVNERGSVSIVYDPIGTGGSGQKQTIPPSAVPGVDGFGTALASGYLDADCYADLIVGARSQAVVLHGSASGLTTAGAQIFDKSAIPGGEDHRDFGRAVTTGDFNHDGFDDIAVGAPGPTVYDSEGEPDGGDGGAVGILYGSAIGITTTGGRWIMEGTDGVPDTASPYDGLGSALAVGDFDGDGFADLAIGAVGEHNGETGGAGGLVVVRGSASGVTTTGSVHLDQSSPGVPGTLEQGDLFGGALAAGDLTGDGRADLVVGSPGEALGDIDEAGSIAILKGSASGVTGTGAVGVDQDTANIPGAAESYDDFGAALAIADLNGDGRLDLAVGSPGEDVDSVVDTGSVTAIYGTTGGLTTTGSRFIDQNSAGVPGADETNDDFADALSVIPGALVEGSPGEEVTSGSVTYLGAFDVLTGNLSAGSFFGPSQFPHLTNGDGYLGGSLS
jgi:hypothetical protein